jgi:hypothetical protein
MSKAVVSAAAGESAAARREWLRAGGIPIAPGCCDLVATGDA